MIAVTPHARGSVLPVRAQPGARKAGVLGGRDGRLRVAVTAAPERGKANDALAVVLARALGCRRSELTLISGATSRDKTFLVEGVTPDALASRLLPFLQAD